MADAFQFESTRRPTRMQQVGRALQGFGAGYRGEGREFLTDLRAQRELRNQKLAEASVMDAQAIQQSLTSNNQTEAIDRLVDRANVLERMGEDASDTYALRDLIVQGNTQGALSEVNTFIDAATRRGLIKPPAPIESKFVSTDARGRLGTVVPVVGGGTKFEPSTGAPAKPVAPTEYGTYTSDGIERYADGPYAGYSLGKIAEMQRSGQLREFGGEIPAITPRAAAPATEFRPPMRMTTPSATDSDQYAGLNSAEVAILQAAKEKERLELERAAAEEERRVAEEQRSVAADKRETEEAENIQKMKEAEMMQLYGLADRLLDPSIYSDKVYSAATGSIESKSPMLGAAMTLGASYQDVTNFRNDLEFLQDIATLDNLGRMTGVLSEADIKLLAQAATGINLSSEPQILQQRLRLMKAKIQKKLIELGYKPEELAEQASLYTSAQSEFDSLLKELEGV